MGKKFTVAATMVAVLLCLAALGIMQASEKREEQERAYRAAEAEDAATAAVMKRIGEEAARKGDSYENWEKRYAPTPQSAEIKRLEDADRQWLLDHPPR